MTKDELTEEALNAINLFELRPCLVVNLNNIQPII